VSDCEDVLQHKVEHYRQFEIGSLFHDRPLCDAIDAVLAELQTLRERLAEAEEHERQTHEQLGAILGTGDALHVLAARLEQRAERLETALRVIAAGGQIDWRGIATAALGPRATEDK
jgi:hypothetical protein